MERTRQGENWSELLTLAVSSLLTGAIIKDEPT